MDCKFKPLVLGQNQTGADMFRSSVNCATVLEGMAGGWRLDVRESTRRALKYRRGKGEFLIVTHDGHGWWDPLSSEREQAI
jgi:hypothetical protein